MSDRSEHERADAHRYEHRGYVIWVSAECNESGSWKANLHIYRDGTPVELNEPESIVPYWLTKEEAIRAGIERAQYLLDRRDGLLEKRNPARGT